MRVGKPSGLTKGRHAGIVGDGPGDSPPLAKECTSALTAHGNGLFVKNIPTQSRTLIAQPHGVYYSADPADFGATHVQRTHEASSSSRWRDCLLTVFNLSAFPIVAAALALSLYLIWPSETAKAPEETSHALWVVPMVLALMAAIILVVRLFTGDTFNRARRRNAVINEISHRRDSHLQWLPVCTHSIDRVIGSFAQVERFSGESQAVALAFLLSPSAFIARTGHSIDFAGQALSHNVVRRIDSYEHDLSACPLPIHKEEKGDLSHRFSVKIDDQRASSLSSSDSRALSVSLLTALAGKYLSFAVAPWQDFDWLTIMTAVASESPVYQSSPLFRLSRDGDGDWSTESTSLTFISALTRVSERLHTSCKSDAQAGAIVDLISDLAANNIIWTILPEDVGTGCHVATTYTSMRNIAAQNIYERFRVSCGLASRNVFLPLSLAPTTQSYHLDIAVPKETYVYRTRVTLNKMKEAVELARPHRQAGDLEPEVNSDRYISVSRARDSNPVIRTSRPGSNVCHVYIRDADMLVATNATGISRLPLLPSVDVEFREVPPGNLLWAVLMSFYIAGLSWTVSFYYSRVFSGDIDDMATVWTTLLFGLPTILAAFLFSRFTKDHLTPSSLVTLFMFATSVFSAFFTMCVAVLLALGKWRWSWDFRLCTLFDFGAERTIESMPWALVVVLATANLTLGIILIMARRRRYKTRLYQL
ncbi:hypothetical protein [Mycolicibacterium sp.]|uniref:hypothetical protein n=1 Tax=Mycolicibacterium sp. TaxID=2320850 RepID=UPI0037C9646E